MSELPIFPAAAISFVVTVAFLLALRPLTFGTKFVDHPGGRKQHSGEVPIIGGIAMFLGVLSGFAVVGVVNELTVGIVFSFFILVVVGAIDDAVGVPPVVRVLVQIAAVIIMVYSSDLMLETVGDPFSAGEIFLGPFALIGTLVVSVTVVNAYNLIDGVDGLAGILALIALLAVSIVGGFSATSTVLALVVAGSIVGFLLFNFPVIANRPVRTFMGDAGSTVLGFAIFWATLGVSQGESAIISPVAGLWFASIPVYDCITCFIRRIASGRSPLTPGRDHFHHTLRRGGFGVRQVLAILGGLQFVYATVGVAASLLEVSDVVLFFLWAALGLSQRLVIRGISARHRLFMLRQLRAGRLSPYRAAQARALR